MPSLYCLISFPAWSKSNSCLPFKLLQEEIATWVLTKIALGFTSRLRCADSLKTWLMLTQQEEHRSKAVLFLKTTAPRPQGQHSDPLRLELSRYLDIWPNTRPYPVLVSTKRIGVTLMYVVPWCWVFSATLEWGIHSSESSLPLLILKETENLPFEQRRNQQVV